MAAKLSVKARHRKPKFRRFSRQEQGINGKLRSHSGWANLSLMNVSFRNITSDAYFLQAMPLTCIALQAARG